GAGEDREAEQGAHQNRPIQLTMPPPALGATVTDDSVRYFIQCHTPTPMAATPTAPNTTPMFRLVCASSTSRSCSLYVGAASASSSVPRALVYSTRPTTEDTTPPPTSALPTTSV